MLSTFRNHQSGVEFSAHIDAYIKVELEKKAILGPFEVPPVVPLHLSPLMTRPKKESELRRVVVDLSWPRGLSINDGIPSHQYLGEPINLTLPTVDYMTQRVRDLGSGCLMYKLDLSRGYRQLRLDPLDWPLMSIQHQGQYYMDMCPPFGLRTAALMMERTTMAVSYIHGMYGFLTRPYIDDFGGAEQGYELAGDAMCTLQDIMTTVGLELAPHKTCPPSTSMVWLGILFDSEHMIMSIPDDKLTEIQTIVKSFDSKQLATRREVQSLMGSLNFIGSVAPPVRIYTNRILNFLRAMPMDGLAEIPDSCKEDIRFFQKLMPYFNGVSVLSKELVPSDDQLEIDACLTGCGGICGSQYYSSTFPESVLCVKHPIAHLEMLNAVVAMRLWAEVWQGQKLQIYCDNMVTVLALQNGRSHDMYLQSCVRNIFLITAAYDIELLICHSPGTTMTVADALSRMHLSEKYKEKLLELDCLTGKTEVKVPDEYFQVSG